MNPGQRKDKKYYIIVLKLDLEVDSRPSPGHGLRRSTRIDAGQYKNKNDYYHGFKTQLSVQPEARSRSRVKGWT